MDYKELLDGLKNLENDVIELKTSFSDWEENSLKQFKEKSSLRQGYSTSSIIAVKIVVGIKVEVIVAATEPGRP